MSEEFEITPVDVIAYKIGMEYQKEKIEREGLAGFLEIRNGMHSLMQLFVDRDDDDAILSTITHSRILEERLNES